MYKNNKSSERPVYFPTIGYLDSVGMNFELKLPMRALVKLGRKVGKHALRNFIRPDKNIFNNDKIVDNTQKIVEEKLYKYTVVMEMMELRVKVVIPYKSMFLIAHKALDNKN